MVDLYKSGNGYKKIHKVQNIIKHDKRNNTILKSEKVESWDSFKEMLLEMLMVRVPIFIFKIKYYKNVFDQ